MMSLVRVRHALAAVAAGLALSTQAWALADNAETLNDFTHYTLIARPDLAAAKAQELLNSGITNAELATLLDEGKVTLEKFERAIDRAQRMPELEAVAADLAQRVEQGRLDMARDPKRIEESIKLLVGNQRQRLVSKNRLKHAGEYAVPALLREIVDGRDEQLKLACQNMLVEIGTPAVTPLCAALPELTGVSQRSVCDTLGAIKHPMAAPYLLEVSMSPAIDTPGREAAARAFKSVGGREGSLAALYADLARQYFSGNESLVAYPQEPTNNVWSYLAHTGLSPTPVPTAIYTEVMAMRTSSKALSLDAGNTPALAVFVASNLKRENDLPAGSVDPVYGEIQYSPEFYATVFGTQICLDVLGMAIDRVDTPLVHDAIAALGKTTGGANLFGQGRGRRPLLEALTYPDRRAQYDAALTLGRALPQQGFTGDHAVVPILSAAIRMGGQSLALAVVADDENRQIHTGQLQKMGFAIVGAGADLAQVQLDVSRAVGVDLAVIRMPSAVEARRVLSALRSLPKTAATPALVIAAALDASELRREYRDDPRVNVVPARDSETFAAAVESVMQRASGGRITDAEAEEYAIKALLVLRDIAISRTQAYSVADAEPALVDALAARSGGTRLLVADILALINSDRAQRALFDSALGASGTDQIDLLARVADSVRLNGNHSEPRHVSALVSLLGGASGELANAAAIVHGALNLPSGDALKLLPH